MGLFAATRPIGGDGLIGDYLNNNNEFPVRRGFVEDSWMYGSFRTLAQPSMLYYNGSTYSLWYKEKANLNQVGIFKQTDENLESAIVNQGTISEEPINHPAPMLHINKTTGFIYVIQNKFHVDSFRVWKSSSPEDITSFNLVGEFGDFCSYIGFLEGKESDIVIQTRAGVSAADFKPHSIIKVNLDTCVYTQNQLTTVESGDSRHYMVNPIHYGISNKCYIGISHRNEGTSGFAGGFYKFSILVTDKGGDYETFYNIDNSFSKNLGGSSVLNLSELETSFSILGTNTQRNTSISEGKIIIVNDDVFIIYMSDDANSRFSIRKYTFGSSSFTDFLIPVATIAESLVWYGPVYIKYNGNNLVFSIAELDDQGNNITNLYACNTDFSNWTKFDINTLGTGIVPEHCGYFYGMPSNLDEAVASNDKYLIVSTDKQTDNGELHFCISNNTFII